MTSEVPILELVRAEHKLRSTAEHALRVKTEHASRAIIRNVVEIAEQVLPVVTDFEGIDNPYELARNALSLPMEESNSQRVVYALQVVNRLEQRANAGTDS